MITMLSVKHAAKRAARCHHQIIYRTEVENSYTAKLSIARQKLPPSQPTIASLSGFTGIFYKSDTVKGFQSQSKL